MHKLMIKTHNITGLKYLCYTRKSGDAYDQYNGSGKYWLRHLKEHGKNVTSELLFQTDDIELFRTTAREYSRQLNVIESSEWANLKLEEGDGGDTVSRMRWITDGTLSKFHPKADPIPEGWRPGRTGCVFNDPARQAEFSKKADKQKAAQSLRKTWEDGNFKRDNEYLVKRMTENNPTKTPETKEKLRQAALNDSENRSKRLKERWDAGLMPKTKGGDNHPSKRPEVREKLRQAATRQHHGKNNCPLS